MIRGGCMNFQLIYVNIKNQIKSGQKFAVKVISKRLMQGREHMILNEIEVLKKVSKGHPNIVTLWDYFETPNNLYLVMDLCTGGELFDRICEKGSFYEEDAAEIVKVVVDAVAYLHDQNIVHRDIKPENLLFKNRESLSDLVIADFGLSKIMDPEKFDGLMTTCGTPGYMAPEVIRKAGHGKPVDLWSIGVLAYFLLCGYTPFDYEAPTQTDELQNILTGTYSFSSEYWYDVSDSAKDFIRNLLIVDPHKRLTAHQALAHPWLRNRSTTPSTNLLPNVRERFNARRMFRKAVDVVKAVNKLAHSPNGSGERKEGETSAEALAAVGVTPMDIDPEEYRPRDDHLVDGNLMVLSRP
ncbi:hypothetical protein HK104_004349 [Borealophlyctis nickersoniae]|nr:hypothetical protein HK104_004349 [Borealophlyctis nickersoniae]